MSIATLKRRITDLELLNANQGKRFAVAKDLLDRAANRCDETAPDRGWLREYFQLTGVHMILTDEGWESGSGKPGIVEEYGATAILDEVNYPRPERIFNL